MQEKPIKFKAKVMFEFEYKVEPKYYLESGQKIEDLKVEDMIKIDKLAAADDIFLFLESQEQEVTVEIEEVKENEN